MSGDNNRANMETTGQSVEELQRELINARLVRDKALSYISTIGHDKYFIQFLGLTCYPEHSKMIEEKMQEFADLFLKQQEIYKKREDRQ